MFGNPLQAEITSALRSAVREAVIMAVELRAVSEANRQSLRRMVQVGETYNVVYVHFLEFVVLNVSEKHVSTEQYAE